MAPGKREEAERRPEWVPVGVGSSLFPDSITTALANLAWWLHYLPGDILGFVLSPEVTGTFPN